MGWRTDSGGDETLRLLAAGAAIPVRVRTCPNRRTTAPPRVSSLRQVPARQTVRNLKMIMASHAVSGQR